jgi:uncharacterized membrane protein YraQ (UPF0718 family)
VKQFWKWSKVNWLLWVVAAAYVALAIANPVKAQQAATAGVLTFVGIFPTLVTMFLFVGLFVGWVSQDFIMRHLGDSSGLKGTVIGAGIGTVLAGPLIGIFPLMKALLAKGGRVGVVVAIVSTWAIKLPMIPLEVALLGWKFALAREGLLVASAFVMAPLMEFALGKQWGPRFRETANQEIAEESA